jgi:hypothetical protein
LRVTNLLGVAVVTALPDVDLATLPRINYRVARAFVRINEFLDSTNLRLRDENQCETRNGEGAEDAAKEIR